MKRLLKGNFVIFTISLTAAAAGALFQLLSPLIIKFTVDSVIFGELSAPYFTREIESIGGIDYLRANLWIPALLIVLVAVCEGLCVFLREFFASLGGENIARRLKDEMFCHIQKLPYDYHVKAKTGELIQRGTSDVDTVRNFFNSQIVEVARTLALVILAVYILWNINVKLTLISFAAVPIVFVIAVVFFFKVKARFLKADEKEGELTAVLQENLSGVRVVRAFGQQKFETVKFDIYNSQLRDLTGGLIHLIALYWSLTDLICFGQILLILIIGINMTVSGDLTIGSLIVFNSYIGMLLWPIRHLGRILSDMGKMQVSLGRIYEILDIPQETDTPDAKDISLTGDIEFSGVCFAYDSVTVLRDISFTAKQGETIAFLGATGSGKSTLMHILLRLYDYMDGSITIGGTELKNIKKSTLRSKIGIVLQEPFLFSKTINENIKMGNETAADSDVIHASETAAFHLSAERFEKGYDTVIGEKGVTLSGGQKQRVAIARTLIKNSDVLIFDDSLSAVDTETDAQIRAALKERGRGITTFIISQRITTLMEADKIYVLESGNITDAGTHTELIARDGLYKRIWDIQKT